MGYTKETEYEFDPIKDQKGNEQAQSVIWSTKSLNMAVDGITKGLPLKVNPFIGNNTKLLKPDLVFKRTDEEIDDYIHCMQDICYFAEKCYVVTPEGLQKIKLRDYQVRYLRHLENNRFSIYIACRQAGKSLTLINKSIILLNVNEITNKQLIYLQNNYTHMYINNDKILLYLPLFEIYHIIDSSFIGTLRYKLYKIIYKLSKIDNKNELNQIKEAKKDVQIIKK